MTRRSIKGRTLNEALGLFEQLMVTGNAASVARPERLEKLAMFEGVRRA